MNSMDAATIGLVLDKVADYVTARIKADKAWDEVLEGESGSHYCSGHCEACRERANCERIRGEIVEMLTAKDNKGNS